MLEEVLLHLNNRFERARVDGDFAVEDGRIAVDGLQEGQYFWVEGSVFNDGLHRHPATDMDDEEFCGRVCLLAVPRAVIDLADEIEGWCGANAEALDSPYQSESFGGYSYSKGGGDGAAGAATWQSHFATRLNAWRKL